MFSGCRSARLTGSRAECFDEDLLFEFCDQFVVLLLDLLLVEILHDPIDREMVRSINEIGHLTGKQTIAEFAENEEIITMLRGMGIDYAQGYGVSEPKRVTRAVA